MFNTCSSNQATYMWLGLVGMCVVGLIFGGMFVQCFALTWCSLHLQAALTWSRTLSNRLPTFCINIHYSVHHHAKYYTCTYTCRLKEFMCGACIHSYLVRDRFVWQKHVWGKMTLQPGLIVLSVLLSHRPPACVRPMSSCHHPSVLLIASGFHPSTSSCFFAVLHSTVYIAQLFES